jgi:hypothetical protein
MGGRLAVYFIIGGLAAAHCAVIFWPPLPRLTIHRIPDDTVRHTRVSLGIATQEGAADP